MLTGSACADASIQPASTNVITSISEGYVQRSRSVNNPGKLVLDQNDSMVFPVRFSEHLWQASVVGLRKANSGSRATLADEAHYAIRDGRGLEYYTLQPDEMGKRVLEFQRAYLRKVIDTV